MSITQWRKKPVTIEAIQWTPENKDEALDFLLHGKCGYRLIDGELFIFTLEGEHHVSPGDWIIKGVKGEFYPCKPDIFAATYEPAEP